MVISYVSNDNVVYVGITSIWMAPFDCGYGRPSNSHHQRDLHNIEIVSYHHVLGMACLNWVPKPTKM
ncbi:hypothetical protein BLOT_001402 [Blomia tropicalis]|nr:hypothetical protein BLOT_001402 [Blomia tropicalis]